MSPFNEQHQLVGLIYQCTYNDWTPAGVIKLWPYSAYSDAADDDDKYTWGLLMMCMN